MGAKKAIKRLINLATLPGRDKPRVGSTTADVVHRENKWRLLHYRPRNPEGPLFKTPVLLVPSLINRHYVLDLMPGKSFTEWMLDRGHDVYCIDWGTPGDEDRYLEFDTIVDTYLGRAVRKVARASETGKTHLLGYCLGGTLTSIYNAAHPEHIASHVALAAPVSFTDDGLLMQWTNTETFDLDALVEGAGNVPWQVMQSAFHLLRPTLNLNKAVYAIDRAWDDQFLDGFLAIETWSNDNISFPGAAYKTYIDELYRKNALIKGNFYLSGKRVDLGDIDTPTLAIAFEHDYIVPLPSAKPLIDQISADDKRLDVLPGGHVGAVVSRKASRHLWPLISNWYARRDEPGSLNEVAAAE
jgi:polyhydroxyalkanoate synthase